MSEQVQATLDQMVAPLRDLMDRHIFTESEIKAIVERRRESEYLLRRRVARKADFLRYIEAEELLEELRQLRTEQRKRDHRKSQQNDPANNTDDDDETNKNNAKQGDGKKKEEQHIGDVHIQQLIHMLFVRAIRKFRSDLSLHLLHVDFCKKQKAWTRLGKVYAEALQIFPRQAGLWIEAASHEFFGPLKSIRSARVLLQRGLRILPTSQDIWVEYFSLELHYAQTLKGRRQILIKGAGNSEEEDVEDKHDSEDSDRFYKIAAIVYKNAIKAIPDSISFRLRFLDTCRRFPDTQNLMNSIQEPLQRDFGSQPEAWIARALYEAEKLQSGRKGDESAVEGVLSSSQDERPLKKARRNHPVIAVLEEGIETIGSDDMKLQAFRFAQRYVDEQEQQGNKDSLLQAQALIDEILEKYSEGVALPDFALEQAEYYVARGDDEKAVEVLEIFCTTSSVDKQREAAPASLWIRWASLCTEDEPRTKRIFKSAMAKIPMNRSDYFHVLLQYFGCLLHPKELDKDLLDNTFQEILLLAPTSWKVVVEDVADYWFGLESIAHAYVQYLDRAASAFGPKTARKIYNKVLFQSTIQLNETNGKYLTAFIDKCLKLELSNKQQLRRLYEKAAHILEGTPLEKKYRQDRNEVVVYR